MKCVSAGIPFPEQQPCVAKDNIKRRQAAQSVKKNSGRMHRLGGNQVMLSLRGWNGDRDRPEVVTNWAQSADAGTRQACVFQLRSALPDWAAETASTAGTHCATFP